MQSGEDEEDVESWEVGKGIWTKIFSSLLDSSQ